MTGRTRLSINVTNEHHEAHCYPSLELYKATYAYDTDKDDELSLKVGETVRVSNKENADWWIAERLDNKTEVGLVPSNVSIYELALL